ncbi:MAG TPA: glycoside hydrolase family 2 TIM barrel-domain containing protein [Solirubrobacteraceae bacterium]|nr:glycoside hydrolase family 2 TIM barrel-domain containing protein [Solirubrobacteraceae bacterium]
MLSRVRAAAFAAIADARAVLALLPVLIVLAGAGAAAGPARAQGSPYPPVYMAQTPHPGALYRDGWTDRYLLDGAWLYRADPTAQGLAQGWWRNVAATAGWTLVSVPSAFNAGDFSPASMYGSVGWYRKDFRLPGGPRGRRWIVRFESINYRATVWLNGRRLGSHAGAYLPFELPLRYLRRGVNRLIVRVDDRRGATDIPSGPGGGWWNYGGIVREVYLRPVDRADLEQVVVRPLLPCPRCAATVELSAIVRNVTGRRQPVAVRGSFGTLPLDLGAATVGPHGSWVVTAQVRIAHPKLWSIYRPHLYKAALVLYGADGRRLSEYVTYSGIRQIRLTANGRLELNGQPLHLRGAFIHESDVALGSALDSAHRARLIGWMRALGGHLLRSHYPLHPELLELADEYGILVWSEIPVNHELSPYLGLPAVRARAEEMLRENIVENENHPSVLAWSIANELATPTTAGEAAYIAQASHLVHTLDPTRPAAMAISAWPGVSCQAAYAPVDALGFNDYFGWFDAAGATADRDGLGPFLDQLRACYPRHALFITEFGFDASRSGPVEERGTYAFQGNSAAYHLAVYARRPWLAGAVYFTLQDFAAMPGYNGGDPYPTPPFNHKGLVDLYGNLKPAFGVVAALYRATRQMG